jgi:hypothetical protein
MAARHPHSRRCHRRARLEHRPDGTAMKQPEIIIGYITNDQHRAWFETIEKGRIILESREIKPATPVTPQPAQNAQ